jgi:hypothetical protein
MTQSIAGRITAAALVLAGVVACAAVVTSELASAADPARRAPRATHIGIPPSDIVVLDLVDTNTTSPKFVRIHPDGSRDTAEFTVPDGRLFVLTSYQASGDWYGRGAAVRFWIDNPETEERRVVLSAVMPGIPETSQGSGAGDVHGSVLEGRVFGTGTQVAIDALNPGNLGHQKTLQDWDTSGDFQINVGGYLVNED